MATTQKANIGPTVNIELEGSPQGDDGTYLFKEVIISLQHWAAGQRCITEVGDDSVGVDGRQSAMTASSRTQVPFHIDGEVHRSIACGTCRSREFNKKNTTEESTASNSHPIVIEPKNKTTTEPLFTTRASSHEMSWQSTGSWPPSCASSTRDSCFPMEGRDLESICKAAVQRIDEVLKEAAEVVKSIQLLRIRSHEPVKCQPTFKPVNLYGSNWLQRIEDSSDRLEMVSPMMCKDHQYKDARELIFQEMAHTSTTLSSIQDLETTDCLAKLQHSSTPPWNLSGSEKADLNLLESKEKVTPCQTPRECQTRSPDYLKKPSMTQHHASAKQTSSSDLPQSGSEDDDETRLAEFAGCHNKAELRTAEPPEIKEAAFHPNPTTQPVAEPALPRTDEPMFTPISAAQCTINGSECDLPGPVSRYDDEDSSPLVQNLDLAQHIPCSTRDMRHTSGHRLAILQFAI